MIKTSIIEMNESEHGLIGFGKIILTHEKNGVHSACYSVPKLKMNVELSEEDAIRIFEKIVINDKVDINLIFRLATESCGIPLFRIKEKSRKEETVFSRSLVMWYCKKHLEYSFSKTGKLFDLNHATAIHGVKIISGEPKYLKENQRVWRKSFMNKLIQNNLLKGK